MASGNNTNRHPETASRVAPGVTTPLKSTSDPWLTHRLAAGRQRNLIAASLGRKTLPPSPRKPRKLPIDLTERLFPKVRPGKKEQYVRFENAKDRNR